MNAFVEVAHEIKDFVKRQQTRTIGIILSTFVLLAAANFVLQKSFPSYSYDIPLWFPIPQSPGLTFNASGLPYAAAFLFLLFWAAKIPKMQYGIFQAWLVGLSFILLGNLIQGNPDIAFRQPLVASNFQYYHDALKITSWVDWLSTFNINQPHLLVHSQTHPPFAVLFHYTLIQLVGDRPLRLAAAMIFIASLSIPIMSWVFAELGLGREARNRLAILFSLIPAVNIYIAVSLDGIVLTTCTTFLLGLVMLVRRPRFSLIGLSLFGAGIIFTNLLTFAGVFALVVGGFMGGVEWLTKRSARVMISTVVAAILLGLAIYALDKFGHYNHIQAFITASRIENPGGFRGLTDPLNYVLSRLECVGEIAFFFSIGCLALFFRKARQPLIPGKLSTDAARIGLVGMATLGLMFLAGLNRVGETARSCMFIYPFMLLFLHENDNVLTRDLMILAGLQTFLMQLLSHYFW